MNKETTNNLVNINRIFYEQVAESFNQTRQTAWKGWYRLWEIIDKEKLPTKLKVLDMGCGNGRFGNYLTRVYLGTIEYTGTDQNQALLEIAAKQLTSAKKVHLRREEIIHNLSKAEFLADDYDLVVCFGVLHHIPGINNRKELIHRLIQETKPGGHLAISCWQFMLNEHQRKRVYPWKEYVDQEEAIKIEIEDLEQNDYLLSWQDTKWKRYCHFVDDAELRSLLKDEPTTMVADYLADGKSGQLNRYLILRKNEITKTQSNGDESKQTRDQGGLAGHHG